MSKFGYIYITTNIINGKQYIGRKKSELFLDSYKGSGTLLKKALQKYGKDNFSVKLIEWCSSNDELNNKEIYYIKEYNASCSDNFYNIVEGGEATVGYKHSEKTKRILSEQRKGKTPRLGAILTEESKEKIRQSKKGVKPPEYTCPHCLTKGLGSNMKRYHFDNCEMFTGIKHLPVRKTFTHTKETKKKISENTKGIKQEIIKCPHCDKEGGKSLMKRYHFNNCKYSN